VCTNISCSLLGADELFDAMVGAAAGDLIMHVSSFECLGACDIAPMASVNGEYIGPLTPDDCEQIVADLRAGRPVLADKQLRYRRCVDPGVESGASEFAAPQRGERTDTAGLTDADVAADRPGRSAPIETTPEQPGQHD
jgi:hypothetical protein